MLLFVVDVLIGFLLWISGMIFDTLRKKVEPKWLQAVLKVGMIGRAAMGLKNLWATKVSGPNKAMHFWKVHYLALITWGAVEDNLRNKSMLSFSGPLHFHCKSLNNALF